MHPVSRPRAVKAKYDPNTLGDMGGLNALEVRSKALPWIKMLNATE
jgi:hypothetical protein